MIEFFVNIEWLKVLITERLKSIIQDLIGICMDQKSLIDQKLTNIDGPKGEEMRFI
jgi:hypothetical protein